MRKLKLEELNRLDQETYRLKPKRPIVVVLDSIRSALNVGSIFRTADAFEIDKIYLCGLTACPPHKEITKTAIGATDVVKWEYFEEVSDVITSLADQGYTIIGIEQTNESIPLRQFTIDPEHRYAVIFGNEVDGISDHIMSLIHRAIEIPQFGTKHSLNVAVCAGIILYHINNSMKTNDLG